MKKLLLPRDIHFSRLNELKFPDRAKVILMMKEKGHKPNFE